MADLTSLTIGTDIGKGEELPAAPANIKDGPNGSVVVDPNVETPKPEEQKAKPTYEELEKNYNELRTKMSQDGAPKVEQPAVTPPVTPLTPEQATKAVTDAGLNLGALEAEYAEKGAISEASLKALEAKGVSRETVTQYIKGQEAIASQLRTDFATITGGEENLKAVLTWAASGLNEAELKAYNQALDSGNVETAKMLMEGINQRYVRANGEQPNLITGESTPRAGDVQPFGSPAEIAAAFSDKRYTRGDKSYHAEVQRRMSVTKNF